MGNGNVIKIADLGLSIHSSQLRPLASIPPELRHELRSALLGVTHEQVGTETTMAPEVMGDSGTAHSRRTLGLLAFASLLSWRRAMLTSTSSIGRRSIPSSSPTPT